MSNHPTQSDDDLRRLLDADTSEPSAELDADIRAAAREALAGEGTGREPARRRRWRIPAVVGVAATVLLAVVVVDQVPRPTPEVASDAMDQSAPAEPSSRPPPSIQVQANRLKSLRAAEDAAPAEVAGLRLAQGCDEAGNALRAAGILVCVMDDHLEVHDVGAGQCSKALPLKHEAGKVTIGRAEDGVEVLVDGETAWRVRCDDGAWEAKES